MTNSMIEKMATLYAERYGVIEYTIEDTKIVYNEQNYKHKVCLVFGDCETTEIYTPYKNRTIVQNQKVKVYYNLHKNCFSIKDYKTGVVIAHAPSVRLENVQFEVNESGRQRVVRERRKNVHAFVIGNLKFDVESSVNLHNKEAFYNPYVWNMFVNENGNYIQSAKSVICMNKKIKYMV